MRFALVQYNPIIGDYEGNVDKIIEKINEAAEHEIELVVFSELSIMGYPPRDLLLRDSIFENEAAAIQRIMQKMPKDIGVILGTVKKDTENGRLYNAAILIENGQIIDEVYKTLLPNYDVFEESRYFYSAPKTHCPIYKGIKLGINICEDLWNDKDFFYQQKYDEDVILGICEMEPELLINLSASPYHFGKYQLRRQMISHIAKKHKLPVIYVNQTGGNDELIFDGSSMVVDADGNVVVQAKCFQEDMVYFDSGAEYKDIHAQEDLSWVWNGLVMGVRDYFEKTGFKKAVLGLSGGIDSSLVACIAAEALGRENVTGIAMPSRYSTDHSKNDAYILAENLGIEYREIPIESIFTDYLCIFNQSEEIVGDLAEENIQARIRGCLLMFVSNREGRMVIATGNKSELAVGYSTLYGDMCGGLLAIGDIPKTMVYQLSAWINLNEEIIPQNVLIKPPSAELKPNQVDQDTLPPYSILDEIINLYVEENVSPKRIVQKGHDSETVYKIIKMIDRAEYKRRQAAPVIKMTSRAFGVGRKMPIAQRYRD